MVPPAPGLLSTITGWPSDLANGSEIARATMSLAPPAGEGDDDAHRLFGPVGVGVGGCDEQRGMAQLMLGAQAELLGSVEGAHP